MANIDVAFLDKEMDNLHKAYNEYSLLRKKEAAALNDYVLQEKVKELISLAVDQARDLLTAAQKEFNLSSKYDFIPADATGRSFLGQLITGAIAQLDAAALNFIALDTSSLAKDDGTIAYSTFNKNLITLRKPWYLGSMVLRASCIVHELFHIIAKSVVHQNDHVSWAYNAYSLEVIVLKLSGIKPELRLE